LNGIGALRGVDGAGGSHRQSSAGGAKSKRGDERNKAARYSHGSRGWGARFMVAEG
jgi:hypothetical protein